MRVEREEAKVVEPKKCKHGGAMVGDTIIFSSHNLKNDNLPRYLSHNKPYVIVEIDNYEEASWKDDDGGFSSWSGGSYDIIIKADQKPVEQPFRPVHVVLESEEDFKIFKAIMGCSCNKLSEKIYDALDQL